MQILCGIYLLVTVDAPAIISNLQSFPPPDVTSPLIS